MDKQFTIDTTSQKHTDRLKQAEQHLGHPLQQVT